MVGVREYLNIFQQEQVAAEKSTIINYSYSS